MRVTRKAAKIDALRLAVKGLDGAQGKIGWFESAKYEDGTPVAGIAAVQEFGSPSRSIPPRSFFRTTATEKRQEWAKTAETVSRAAAQGKIAPDKVMEAVVMVAEGNVRATITKIMTPPLSPITIELRRRKRAGGTVTGATVGDAAKATKSAFFNAGSGAEVKPLVDTGILLNTLTSETTKK